MSDQSADLERLASQIRSLEARVAQAERRSLPDLLGLLRGRSDVFGGIPDASAGSGPYALQPLIAADAITANEIAAGSIRTEHIVVGGLGGGRNMIFNGSFESDAENWNLSAAGPPTIFSGATSDVIDGVKGLHFAASGTAKYAVTDSASRMTFLAGHWYTASVWMGGNGTTTGGMGLVMEGTNAVTGTAWSNVNGFMAGATPVPFALVYTDLPSTWTRVWVTWQQDATQTDAYILLTDSYGGTATGDKYFDAVQVEEGSIATAWGPNPGDLANSTREVVIDASGIAVTNGAITVTNAGAVVIIDGTSDMFKIVATGTQSVAFAAAPSTSTASTTITGVTSGSVALMVLAMASTGNAFTSDRGSGDRFFFQPGGTELLYAIYNNHGGSGTDDMVVAVQAVSAFTNPGGSAYQRYYLLKEASL